ASSSVGAGTRIVKLPQITTREETITIITGYQEVSVGTITVPVITWETSSITEQTGTEEVKVGQENYRFNVTLEQVGYYNPNAPTGQKFREYLIEGIDYSNTNVVWANAGNEQNTSQSATAVTSNYKDDTNYLAFGALNDAQKQAVLNYTGYMKLYDFSYSASIGNEAATLNKVRLEKSLNGVSTNTLVDPSWKGKPDVIYHIKMIF
ncbi:hypothetical protein MJH12_17050, partial [bacterium]|nr:hypothetical protein [bacterium]